MKTEKIPEPNLQSGRMTDAELMELGKEIITSHDLFWS